MSERVKELIKKASNTGEHVSSALFHVIEAITALAVEVDALSRGLETARGHVHAPPPTSLDSPAILIEAARALALADAIREFVDHFNGTRVNFAVGHWLVHPDRVARLACALREFESGAPPKADRTAELALRKRVGEIGQRLVSRVSSSTYSEVAKEIGELLDIGADKS
jgi:hypothetical protein